MEKINFTEYSIPAISFVLEHFPQAQLVEVRACDDDCSVDFKIGDTVHTFSIGTLSWKNRGGSNVD